MIFNINSTRGHTGSLLVITNDEQTGHVLIVSNTIVQPKSEMVNDDGVLRIGRHILDIDKCSWHVSKV